MQLAHLGNMWETQVLPFLPTAEVCKSLHILSYLNNSNVTQEYCPAMKPEAWIRFSGYFCFMEHHKILHIYPYTVFLWLNI